MLSASIPVALGGTMKGASWTRQKFSDKAKGFLDDIEVKLEEAVRKKKEAVIEEDDGDYEAE
jgi:hypothetical protein